MTGFLYRKEHVQVVRDDQEHNLIIYTMTLTQGQNQFWPDSVAQWNHALDAIEQDLVQLRQTANAASSAPNIRAALIITGQGKYFSTGLHLTEIGQSLDQFLHSQFLPLLGRLLSTSLVVIAAINGHAYAGGMCMALACDYRIMRKDRGFMCMNEIDIPSAMPDGMAALLKAKIRSPQVLRECVMEGKKYTPEEAVKLELVDEIVAAEDLVHSARSMAAKHARPVRIGEIVRLLKQEMYREAFQVLVAPRKIEYLSVFLRNKL